jgi:DNA-directed RNA polymerase subunit M/transcription elongation factor TFIIS
METKPRVTTNYCLECGGVLSYDSALKLYACKSCGLTVSAQQLMEGRYKMRERESPEEQRKRRQNEYLKWWLSKKPE